MYEFLKGMKSSDFLIASSVVLAITMINGYLYLDYTNYFGKETYEGINSFSFWNYTRFYNIGSVIMFITPIIILYLSLKRFADKFSGSFLVNMINRKEYKKILKRELFLAYLRGLFLPVIISILILIFGMIILPHDITNIKYADPFTNFYEDGVSNPLLYAISVTFLLVLFSIMIVNFGFIVYRFVKKISISLILTFTLLNITNFLVGNIGITIANFIGSEKMLDYFYNVNIYEGYAPQSTLLNAYLHTFIYVIITTLILAKVYKDKEGMVLDFV